LLSRHQSTNLDIREAKVGFKERKDDGEYLLVPVNDRVAQGQRAEQEFPVHMWQFLVSLGCQNLYHSVYPRQALSQP
jgi:hypothetical protein